MKEIEKISPEITYVGVNDRTKHLFEGLWPLPQGVSYNSYLVMGQKTALIDTVEADFADRFERKILSQLGGRPIDYLVINHMEPDHSSSIARIRAMFPNVQIVGNAKTLQMIEGYYGISDGVIAVCNAETLSLGGVTLQFFLTPMVHWPETMMTYCHEREVLFSGDAFGCFGALRGAVVDEDMNTDIYWPEMYRYYSNIVGKYGAPVQKALQKLSGLPLATICPTHGPVWRKELARVVGIYNDLSLYRARKGVVIAYGSMYGNTEQTAERIASELAREGVTDIVMHNMAISPLSDVLRDVFIYDTLIIGSSTYNGSLLPPVEALTRALSERCVQSRKAAVFGSFTWAGAAVKKLSEFVQSMYWQQIGDGIELKQGFDYDKSDQCRLMAHAVAESLK